MVYLQYLPKIKLFVTLNQYIYMSILADEACCFTSFFNITS